MSPAQALRALKAVGLLCVAGFLLTLCAAAYIAADGLSDRLEPADLAVVLGNKVEPDGRPSARLAARLDRALEVYRAGLVKEILVSGGTGSEGYDEARAMGDYLVAHGVPAAAVRRDPGGFDTWLTARHTAELMRQRHLTSVIIVSQFFHITRTRMALRRFGVTSISNAHARIWELRDPWSLLREVLGCADYAVRAAD